MSVIWLNSWLNEFMEGWINTERIDGRQGKGVGMRLKDDSDIMSHTYYGNALIFLNSLVMELSEWAE